MVRNKKKTVSITLNGTEHHYTPKTEIPVLGNMINMDGNTVESMEARLSHAGRTVYKNMKIWTNNGNSSEKLRKWDTILHSCRGWHLTSKSLHRIRTWELGMLRKILNMRRKEGKEGEEEMKDGTWMFHKRSAKQIYHLMANLQIQPLHVKVTTAYIREGWREKNLTWEGRNPLAETRTHKDNLWWIGVKTEPAHKREKGETKQAKQGISPPWEDLFVKTDGPDWRHKRDKFQDGKEWERYIKAKTDVLLKNWRLPTKANLQPELTLEWQKQIKEKKEKKGRRQEEGERKRR